MTQRDDDELEALRREWLREAPGDRRWVLELTAPLTRADKDRIVERVLSEARSAASHRGRGRVAALWLGFAAAAAAIALAFGSRFGAPREDAASKAEQLIERAADYRAHHMFEDAEPLLREALELRKREFGSQHTQVAASLNALADLYRSQRMDAKALPLYRQALAIQPNAVF